MLMRVGLEMKSVEETLKDKTMSRLNRTPNDPLGVSAEWHRFLYRSILLEWETKLIDVQKFPRFNPRRDVAGVKLIKFDNYSDFSRSLVDFESKSLSVDQFMFFSKGQGLREILRLLRNCVAHANYSPKGTRRICFRHEFNGRVQLVGSVNFSKFKIMVQDIQRLVIN